MNDSAAQPLAEGPAAGPLWNEGPAPVDPELTSEAGPLLPRPSRRRWPWLLASVVVLGAGGAGVLAWRGSAASGKPSIESVKTDRGRIVVRVTASGTVSALKTVQVGSQVSGRVAELHADFNDQVKKGQLLARLDTQLFRSAVEQARASLAVSRSNVTRVEAQRLDAERTLAREKALGDAKFLAQEQVDLAASAVEVARAAVAGARAQAQQAAASLRQAELNLAMTAIYSPIDGVVISRSVDVGQTVAASLQAPTIFTLAEDLRKMQVEAHVAEGDVSKLQPGMDVTFTVDAFTGQTFAGKLRQVRNAATTVQSVVTYDAIVDVDNPDLKLRPGMTANVSFVVADRPDVVRIPNAALRFRPSREALAKLGAATGTPPAAAPGSRPPAGAVESGAPRSADRKTVFVTDQGAVRPVRVRVGVTDGSFTELVEGNLGAGISLVTDLGEGSSSAAASGRAAAGAPMTPGLGGPGMGAAPGMGAGRGGRR
jgi:HlyD family secretion protein